MKFLIQWNLMNEDQLQKVKKAVENFDIGFCEIVPFTREIITKVDLNQNEIFPYGSTLLTTVGESDYNWKGLCFDLNTFCYKAFLDNRDDMTNSNVITIKEALYLLENYSMTETAVQFGSLTKKDGNWIFKAVGAGFNKGLGDFVNVYRS